jgi:hypothetical protein
LAESVEVADLGGGGEVTEVRRGVRIEFQTLIVVYFVFLKKSILFFFVFLHQTVSPPCRYRHVLSLLLSKPRKSSQEREERERERRRVGLQYAVLPSSHSGALVDWAGRRTLTSSVV